MAKRRDADVESVGSDAEHPIHSRLDKDGSLYQQGISAEGFQREVSVHRHTELVPGGKTQKYKFCWDLTLYQHPGCRKVIPLGCVRSDGTGRTPAPKLARQFARAFHKAAQAGYDPRTPPAGGGGGPRGLWWHRVVVPMLCGGGEIDPKRLRKYLKDQGYWREDVTGDSIFEGLRRSRKRSRRR